MSRTISFRSQSYNVIAYPLAQVTMTDNCRRPCPTLWNLGLDPWEAYRKIVSDDIDAIREGVAVLEKSPRFVRMAASITEKGQLQAIGLRSYRARTGRKVKVEVPVKGGAEGQVEIKEQDEFVDRGALSFGNGRLFAVALAEGRRKIAVADGTPSIRKQPYMVDAILMRLTCEQSRELSITENDDRDEMDDLDWGLLFDADLKSINPDTERPYTIKEVAAKRRKNYHWVRGRAALPYLPVEMLKEIADWNKVNIDALCQLALRYKAGAKLDKPVDQGEAPAEQSGTVPILSRPVVVGAMPTEAEDTGSKTATGVLAPAKPEVSKSEGSALPVAVQPKKRRTPLTLAQMALLYREQKCEAGREAVAACMQMTRDEAEEYAREIAEKESRKANR
jgi:hypothetical protein